MKRPADSTVDVPAPALRQEALLFDELVRRPDSLLNPLASARQLMVNDVLTLVRRYTQTRLVSTFDWKQGKITEYEIDTDVLRRPINVRGYGGSVFLPQCAAWDNGWALRTEARKFEYFPLDNTGPRNLDCPCQSEENGCTELCKTTGPGALVTFLHSSDDDVTFCALRDASHETKPSSAASFSGRAMYMLNALENFSSIGENHVFCDAVRDSPVGGFENNIDLVDLVAVQKRSLFESSQLPWVEPGNLFQTSRPLVLECWFDEEHLPEFIVDCRQEHITSLNPKIDERVGPVDYVTCVQIDDDTVACIGSRYTFEPNNANHWMQFMLYDRRALRHSVVRTAHTARTSLEAPIFHVSEPLNVIN